MTMNRDSSVNFRTVPQQPAVESVSGIAHQQLPQRKFQVLGVDVSAVQIPDVVAQMDQWIQARDRCRFIAVTGMHGVTEAHHDAGLKHILNAAALNVPDGMPLVWLGRLCGFPLRRRVYGPELMSTFCKHGVPHGVRHFLYGGNTGVAEKLAGALRARFPGIQITGTICPPFRSLTAEEKRAEVEDINSRRPDVVWVGLSAGKQEKWMFEQHQRLRAPVLVGVGAAFDFLAGLKKQAPVWMQENGLEWLFRLLQEPRRLWYRYLVYGSQFICLVSAEMLHCYRRR
jgi:N-acetylglucosaminyldiphosphoundecaprenol N-acetyl-beta-D-mannosaminyltransferase